MNLGCINIIKYKGLRSRIYERIFNVLLLKQNMVYLPKSKNFEIFLCRQPIKWKFYAWDMFYCCDKNTLTKSHLEKKGFIELYFHITIHNSKGLEQELKTGIEIETMKEILLCWLAPQGLLSLLSYIQQTTCPSVALPIIAGPSHNNLKKNAPTSLPTAILIEALSQLRSHLPRWL